ncbi:zinc-dependent metalloprotease [uncultured Umboniibacter sp.]|uniref:zinc-dependent metalloprotease n=1 Tax=uncultured Umboniibacter sp. TaxID=1798917 RepID=UPI00260475C6|nr:zinc-dependent metalloprotease [uncultured Umboniibacter sp.]
MRSLVIALSLSLLLVGCNQEDNTWQPANGFIGLTTDTSSNQLHLDVPKDLGELLYYPSLARGIGSNDIGLDRGLLGDTKIVSFVAAGERLLLVEHNMRYRSTSANPAETQAVEEAFPDHVIWSFPIINANDTHWRVDATDFAFSDSMAVSDWLASMDQGSYTANQARSMIHWDRSKAFPENLEIEAVVSFTGTGAGSYLDDVVSNTDGFTVYLHHSFLKLPEDGFDVRPYHPNSGYFSVAWQDYTVGLHEDLTVRVIPRHRLEKMNPDAASSPAVEPIIYYLDPGVPEPVKTALFDGGMWWNQAFEAIGYEDAFQIRELPEGADPMDARYNVINWVHRATRGWSYGASVIDPRTGEIIKGHVTLGSLRVRQDILIADALLDQTNSAEAEAMALARIRQLSAHEIGHTLGIAHNFAASERNRASVMDYPHPLIDIASGAISLAEAYDNAIGEWDTLVVDYGYGDDFEAAKNALLRSDIGYVSDYEARPLGGGSASGHLWDNGADPVNELDRLVAIRELALSRLSLNAIDNSDPIGQLDKVVVPVYNLTRFQVEAVAKQIGGYHLLANLAADPAAFIWVDKAKQIAAADSLLRTLEADFLLLPDSLAQQLAPMPIGFSRDRESSPSQLGRLIDQRAMAEAYTRHVLAAMLAPQRLNRLSQAMSPLSVDEYLTLIFERVAAMPNQSPFNERSQYLLARSFGDVLANPATREEVKATLQWQLKGWIEELDTTTASGFRLHQLLTEAMGKIAPSEAQVLPPGSPI